MYFEIIVVSVSFFIVFDCNNVKSHIVKVNVLRQKQVTHQNIPSD